MESSGWKPNVEISPNCPRCGSCNTKFCYYNNYSSTQPRYFCKGCRRYWTRGGSLRNVPVGGGCRKNRRGSKTSFRQSMDALPPKISPNGDKKNPSSCSTSGVPDAPNIDLALVYANFLHQKPDSSVQSTVGLPEDDQLGVIGSLTGPQLMSEGNQMYSYGFNSMPKTLEDYGIDQRRCSSSSSSHDPLNFELPPLPGEEAALHDMMWSNSASHSSQPLLFGADAHDADLLMDNWSDFDLSRP